MALRGIRGAVIAAKNSKKEIVSASKTLLKKMVSANKIKVDDVASVIFSVTSDLNVEFPAIAAREIGWLFTPLMCTNEIPVPGSLRRCIRILVHFNSSKAQKDIKHIYLGKATELRPDLKNKQRGRYYSSGN